MTIEQAFRQVADRMKKDVVDRYGEKVYESVLSGHVLTESVGWFAPYISGKAPATPPLSPLGELEEVGRFFSREVKRPALEVECGLCCVGLSLGVDLAADRDAARVDLLRRAFPDSKIERAGIEDLPGDGTYATVMTAFGLGRMDAGRGQPIFLDFVTHCFRLLKPGGRILVAERKRYQDNVVEPLVALDYEIAKISAIRGSSGVLVLAIKP